MYSQNTEEEYILNFFGNRKGTLLEIGAFHPEVFSNSRALIEKGWDAVLVEPSPKCFNALADFYKDNENVYTVQIALGTQDGKLKFYDSAGANATAYEVHYNRWKSLQLDYEETIIDCVSWETFYNNFPGVYNFISIDCEGMDYSILKQIDLDETETELLCVEYGYNEQEISQYLRKSGFTKVLLKNSENLIVYRD